MTVDHAIRGACLGWRPPTMLKPWEWARRLKISNSERASKFDPDQLPWVKAPMECAGDVETRQIVCVWPTGAGKSTLAEAIIPYVVSEDPGAMLYASQTDADAKFWAETRLKPVLKSCAELAGLWPEDRHQSRKLEIIFPHMPLIMAGANLSSFQEKSVRWLYGDECWRWAAGLIREFKARLHGRWNSKTFLVSQGGVAGTEHEDGSISGGDEFWQEWKKSDCGEFSWKCDCGEAQPYEWDSLKYDSVMAGKRVDEQATSKTARMSCRSCPKEYPDTVQNRRKLADSNMENGVLGYIASNPSPIDFIKGFHVDSLAVWWLPWSEEVLGFLEAKRLAKAGVIDKLRQFTQKRRAKFWADEMADGQVVVSRGGFTKLEHEDGAPIDGETIRFATVDCGGADFWVVVAAWRQGGTARVLWEGSILSQGGDEPALTALTDRYCIPRPQVMIDIGYEQDRILDLCVSNGFTGIKGDGVKDHFDHPIGNGKVVQKLHSTIKRARSKSGGIAKFFFVASNQIKDILARMIQNGQFEFPADVSKAFENHLKCERRTVEINEKTSEEKPVWKRPGSKPNHLWDDLYYQVGAALAFRVFDDLEG